MAERALAVNERFTYTQLDASKTGSFRILKIQPGGKEAPIVCNLVHARLDARPPYEAISYVWGSTDRPISIKCDENQLYITENLRDALVRVRLPDRPRSVWADSICIDQDNLDEKGHQVQFMGEIYSNASRVLICLGSDDEGNAQKAMSIAKDVSNMIAETLPGCEQRHGSFPHLAPDDPWLHDDRWPAFHSVFFRPWFYRGWAVQEAALAQDAVVLWGEAECSWVPLMDTEIWFWARGPILNRKPGSSYIHRLLYQSMSAHRMRLQPLLVSDGNLDNLGVPDFLNAARGLILSNPVDRVFAFLAVLDKISPSALNIKPDYSKTPHSVFAEFAVAYLQATRDLSLLRRVQHTNESLELGTPSWVPLWNICECAVVRVTVLARQWDSPAHFTLEQGSGTPRLTVQALLFDTIRFASDPLLIKTVEDVFQLWQIIWHMDESADVYKFLKVMCSGCWMDDLEAWKLQFSTYGRHLLASSSSSNSGTKHFFRVSMT